MNRSARPPDPEPDPAVPAEPQGDYTDTGVPTLDHVRNRIEERYATARGTTELVEESAAGRSVAQQQEDRDAAARERLEQIRRSLKND
jgi:phage shock protein A